MADEVRFTDGYIILKLVERAKWLDEQIRPLGGMLGRSRRHGYTRVDLKTARDGLRGVFDFVAWDLIERRWPDDSARQYVLDVIDRADQRLNERNTSAAAAPTAAPT
jgi:hypothetical protein